MASKAGSDPGGTARGRFLACVAHLVAYPGCDDISDSDAPRSSESAIGSTTRLMPMAVRAMTSASMRSVLAVPGHMSRAFFMVSPVM